MGFTPFATSLPLAKVAATPGVAGFALQNATPTIFSFVTPNDGAQHRYMLFVDWHVTVAETGGACTLTYTAPDGSVGVSTFKAGGQGVGTFLPNGPQMIVAGPNTTVTVAQSSALTLGASLLFAELWGA